MQKFSTSDVKPFEFTDLKGDHVVTHAKFEEFSFKTIEGKPFNSQLPSEDAIRQERSFEGRTEFKIDNTVRDSRGLARQEQNDTENKIQAEVKKRIEAAYQDAYKEGLETGRAEGSALAFKQLQDSIAGKVEELNQVIVQVQNQSEKILSNNHQEIHEFIKRFTKWIVLKEINEKAYLSKLLEKLILELNSRKNLIVKVGKDSFADMPEVVQAVEAKLGQLSNIRIEIVPEITYPGIILESENGLIDGSLEGVFANIDKIFEQVNGNE